MRHVRFFHRFRPGAVRRGAGALCVGAVVLAAGCDHGSARSATSTPPPAMRVVKDVQYAGGAADADRSGHMLDLYLPQGAAKAVPLVIWTNGSAFLFPAGRDRGDLFANRLVPRGYAVAAVAVRGSGQATFPAQRDDTLAAVAFLRRNAAQYGLDPARFAYMGHSSGGWSSAVAGVEGSGESAVQAAVALSPVTDVAATAKEALPDDMWRIAEEQRRSNVPGVPGFRGDHEAADSPEGKFLGGRVSDNMDKAAAASPALHVAPAGPPFLIVHGTEDEYVPFAQGTTLYFALKQAGRDVTFVMLPGASHRATLPPWSAESVKNATSAHSTGGRTPDVSAVSGDGWDVILGFLDAHLKP
ncbi:phospholipase/Carboxylesterase [Segniliparus rotundus DSM 44985]|uniref:Phospholipase/Carboxylesterase n=1 Tax=Segniliparus rotundus (strain ATCC BAA-972 / CDC 1076 / CIP 108378 / DSM 44985 / JCM 13578) TaxID=640132 RepID=D6ZB24_SEGRD|nr:prolyl oligopeptidase family serine peptidase [Segniliparus rotundus]ADG96783.1 phospholipase/Carboxylesterase [Segniliparus rotundus DSM 44985]